MKFTWTCTIGIQWYYYTNFRFALFPHPGGDLRAIDGLLSAGYGVWSYQYTVIEFSADLPHFMCDLTYIVTTSFFPSFSFSRDIGLLEFKLRFMWYFQGLAGKRRELSTGKKKEVSRVNILIIVFLFSVSSPPHPEVFPPDRWILPQIRGNCRVWTALTLMAPASHFIFLYFWSKPNSLPPACSW